MALLLREEYKIHKNTVGNYITNISLSFFKEIFLILGYTYCEAYYFHQTYQSKYTYLVYFTFTPHTLSPILHVHVPVYGNISEVKKC